MQDTASPEVPVTHLQLIRIASRIFAAYLLFWVIADIVALPHEILGVVRVVQDAHAAGASLSDPRVSFSFRIEMLYLSANTFCIALWLMGAGWFYRCGPRIQGFFSPETTTEPES